MNRKNSMHIASSLQALVFGVLAASAAGAADLTNMTFNVLAGEKVEVRFTLSEPVAAPKAFTTDNPARLSLDLDGVSTKLDKRSMTIAAAQTRSVAVAEAGGRTRVVFSLDRLLPYSTRVEGNELIVLLGDGSGVAAAGSASAAPAMAGSGVDIRGVDFRRGDKGEGRVVFNLGNPKIGVDVRQEGRTVYAEFQGASIPESLIRRLDVVDFGTPARIVEVGRRGGNVVVKVETANDFEYLAYQADNQFTLELKPLTAAEVEQKRAQNPVFTGDRLTLTFQSIEVRALLQIIAEYTGINMVTSDTVQGSMALHLQNVPWDQALDIVLKTRGLDKRQNGNVMLVAPADEIAARERLSLETEKAQEDLAPLRSEFIQVNYAKAIDLAKLLKDKDNTLLSERGQVSVDDRTNTLLVQDTSRKLDEVRQLVRTLDIPVRQVLIESRVVIANDDFTRELGVRFGVSDKNSQSGIGGSLEGAEDMATGGSLRQDRPALRDRLNVNMPVATDGAGRIGFNLMRLTDGTILDLELSALEAEGRGEVIASPRVLTANQKESFIESGIEIPYEQVSSAGATNITFRKAVLALKVKPQITPDDRVFLDLSVTKDSLGIDTPIGPAINTKEVGTQVLVANGETVVLGGIYEQELTNTVRKIPLLGDLPGIGFLFRNKVATDKKTELLIFVTPKIVKDAMKIGG